MVLQQAQPEDKELLAYANTLKDQLYKIVKGLNTDNFIVRKQRDVVEIFANRDNWNQLGDKDVAVIESKLSGFPSGDDDHETARRVDLIVLNLQIAILQNSDRRTFYQNAIRDIAAELEDKKAIPLVAAQMELILELQTDPWWKDITLPVLEDVRTRIRDLLKFINLSAGVEYAYTDFEDNLVAEDAAEYNIVKSDPNLQDYRVRVERYIREHQDHITIRRLKNNELVSKRDLEALEEMLFSRDAVIPREEYEKLFGERPIGLLVRSVVGLNRNAAKQAFAEFLEKVPLHPDQMTFLNEIVEYLVQNGVMEPKELFESPFTHYHDLGLVGVMGDELGKKVVKIINNIKENAEVA